MTQAVNVLTQHNHHFVDCGTATAGEEATGHVIKRHFILASNSDVILGDDTVSRTQEQRSNIEAIKPSKCRTRILNRIAENTSLVCLIGSGT